MTFSPPPAFPRDPPGWTPIWLATLAEVAEATWPAGVPVLAYRTRSNAAPGEELAAVLVPTSVHPAFSALFAHVDRGEAIAFLAVLRAVYRPGALTVLANTDDGQPLWGALDAIAPATGPARETP